MVSVIIPTHNPKYLQETLESVARQTAQYFEVIVAPNGVMVNDIETFDKMCKEVFKDRTDIFWRVKPLKAVGKVGAIKHEAFSAAKGDWLLELDHDDKLFPTCVQRIEEVGRDNPNATMLYSDCHYSGKWFPWSPLFGWTYYNTPDGKKVNVAPPALPQNLSRIYFGPDHVRVYRADWYHRVGGHDVNLDIADDHDMSCRAWLDGPMVHINECLYEYRVHEKQTSKERFQAIQDAQWRVYFKYIERMALEWSRRESLLALDLGAQFNPRKGFISVDLQGAQIKANLREDWPLGDNSCGCIRASDLLEHLPDAIHTMNEAWRCLKHGGFFLIRVPSTDGRAAFRDPTHCSFWNLESFWYYTKSQYRNFIPAFKGRFQNVWTQNITVAGIIYVESHLLALKDGPRFYGLMD
jgi:glycosyltransferase involved in cell wall biosynthesis